MTLLQQLELEVTTLEGIAARGGRVYSDPIVRSIDRIKALVDELRKAER